MERLSSRDPVSYPSSIQRQAGTTSTVPAGIVTRSASVNVTIVAFRTPRASMAAHAPASSRA